MKKNVLVFSLCAVAVAALLTFAMRYWLERTRPDLEEREGSLRSRVLGENRHFIVHLPESYQRDPARRYPVIYVLDGTSQDGPTARSAALLAQDGAMPEVIVVGIANAGIGTRDRDYTPPGMRLDEEKADGPMGEGDRFLSFLETELIPRIESDYRVERLRLFVGHSRGALVVIHSLLTKSSLFDAHIAHSPALWRDGDAMIARLGQSFASSAVPSGFLYLSLGDEENEKMTASFQRAVALLETKAPTSLIWRADITRGAGHKKNPELATPVGLQKFFSTRSVRPDAAAH
jgi:predicted alpha/beta superfamily hydrolase